MLVRNWIVPIVLSLHLAACGDGGGVASVPAPVAPAAAEPVGPYVTKVDVQLSTVSSPATKQGTSETIALIERSQDPSSFRLAAPSEVKISTYQSGPLPTDVRYTIQFAPSPLPGGLSSLSVVVPGWGFETATFRDGSSGSFRSYGYYDLRFGQHATETDTWTDGKKDVSELGDTNASPDQVNLTVGDNSFWHSAVADLGLSYVSFGAWSWGMAQPQSKSGNFIEGGLVRFVYGERTPAGSLPTSGTATYTATTLRSEDPDWLPNSFIEHGDARLALTADFARQTIAAQINQDLVGSSGGDAIGGVATYTTPGLDLHGTGTIASSGSISIPLSGVMNSFTESGGSGSFPVSGALDGAFFGPNAEQVGGVYWVSGAPGTASYSDAFIGAKK